MKVDRKEALRYMGYRGQHLDENTERLLNDCIDEVISISKNGFLYNIFDIERTEEGLRLKGSTLVLRGKDIGSHLSKSEKCAVMAVTLGLEADRRIAVYSKTNLTKGIVFDACAAAAVESLCDMVQEKIEKEAEAMGLKITKRFSPGYGDFDIEIQKEIVRVLDTYRKIGLSVNESSIMIPRKSVTAFIGLQAEECDRERHYCGRCDNRSCMFRKDENDNE